MPIGHAFSLSGTTWARMSGGERRAVGNWPSTSLSSRSILARSSMGTEEHPFDGLADDQTPPQNTPLWFYILRGGRTNGGRLTGARPCRGRGLPPRYGRAAGHPSCGIWAGGPLSARMEHLPHGRSSLRLRGQKGTASPAGLSRHGVNSARGSGLPSASTGFTVRPGRGGHGSPSAVNARSSCARPRRTSPGSVTRLQGQWPTGKPRACGRQPEPGPSSRRGGSAQRS